MAHNESAPSTRPPTINVEDFASDPIHHGSTEPLTERNEENETPVVDRDTRVPMSEPPAALQVPSEGEPPLNPEAHTRRSSSIIDITHRPVPMSRPPSAQLLPVPGSKPPSVHGNGTGASATSSRSPSVRPPSAINAPTQVTYDDPTFQHPPELKYTLRTRKKSIAIFWTLIVLDCVAMPIALYFGLWYGTSLSHNAVFSISTGALGSVSIFEYFLRFHRLWKNGSTCRVIGARRFYLDWFHWNLSVAWIAVMIELIVGTIPENPPIRLLAMPVASMVFAFGVELLIIDVMRIAGYKSPCRISSLPQGAPLRPGIYSIIEDVCAVDGGGGTEFRQRLNLRYQASHSFRQMLHRLTLFWAFGACAIASATTAIIFTIQRDAAYVVGWVLPFVWAGIWALITWWWVERSLKDEYAKWGEMRWKA